MKTKPNFKSKCKNEHIFDFNIVINANHSIPEQTLKQLELNINSLISQNLYEYYLEIDRKK